MNFQVVVLAGGTSKKLIPLVSKEVPKSLLPVANRPVLSYVLELLEQSNLKDLIVVVEGEDAALLVGGWNSSSYVDRLHVEVLNLRKMLEFRRASSVQWARSVLQEVLTQKPTFRSLKQDVLPYLVRSQLRSELMFSGAEVEENGNEKDASYNDEIMLSQLLANASTPSFHELYTMCPNGSAPVSRKTHKCCAYIASKSKYCARLNSLQEFYDINQDASFCS